MYVRCVNLMLAQEPTVVNMEFAEESVSGVYVSLDSPGPSGHHSPPVEGGDEGESASLVPSQSGKKPHGTRISSKPILDTLDVSVTYICMYMYCVHCSCDIDCVTLCSWNLFIEDQRTR